MKDRVHILFIEDPKNPIYLEGTYTPVKLKEAIQFVDTGVGVVYDRIQGKQIENFFLPKDLPKRDQLIKAGIYTPEQY